MNAMKKLMWPGILLVLIGGVLMLHIIMFTVIHSHPGMTQDLRQLEAAPAPTQETETRNEASRK